MDPMVLAAPGTPSGVSGALSRPKPPGTPWGDSGLSVSTWNLRMALPGGDEGSFAVSAIWRLSRSVRTYSRQTRAIEWQGLAENRMAALGSRNVRADIRGRVVVAGIDPCTNPSTAGRPLGRLTQSGPQLLPSLPESPHWYGSARQWGSSALLVVRLVGANGPVDHGPIGQRSDSDT
jgi:hypothetical protein